MLIVGAAWVVVFGEAGLIERHQLDQRLWRAQDRVASVEQRNAELRAEVRRLRDDPVSLRRAAAERLLAAEPGSTIYRFSDDDEVGRP